MKQLEASPWDDIQEKYHSLQIVPGLVTRTMDFGAFVELEPGVDGLLHISQMSNRPISRPDEIVSVPSGCITCPVPVAVNLWFPSLKESSIGNGSSTGVSIAIRVAVSPPVGPSSGIVPDNVVPSHVRSTGESPSRTISGSPLGSVASHISTKASGPNSLETLALKNAKPARYPHADNTDASALELANLFDAFVDDFDLGAYRRWAMYNVWRAITPPPQDFPLAVCDARSIDPGDEVTVTAHKAI